MFCVWRLFFQEMEVCLGSADEIQIKADRAEDPSVSSEQTIKKLQEETAKLAGEKSRT